MEKTSQSQERRWKTDLSPLLQLGCLLLYLACLVWSGYLHFHLHQIRQEFDAAVRVEQQDVKVEKRTDCYFPPEKGEKGETGYGGLPGVPGLPGESGKDGLPGLRGAPGKDGLHGLRGAPGRDGSPGLRGAPGRDGSPGLRGLPGKDGRPGLSGEPGMDGRPDLPGVPGMGESSYTYWGKSTCPDDTYHYSGIAFGIESGFTKFAGGQDLQCVDDTHSQSDDTNSTSRGLSTGPVMSAVHINLHEEFPNITLITLFHWAGSHGKQLACAVCTARGPTVVTEYGRKDCRPGWSKLYRGYVMAPFRDRGRVISSGSVCVDERPRPVQTSAEASRLASELSFVRSGAGFSEQSRLISCVVCVSD